MRILACLVVGLWFSNAEAVSIHSVSGGYEYSNPLGANAQKYNSPFGASLNVFIDDNQLGKNFQGVVAGQFLMLPFRGVTGMSVMGFAGYVGVRTHPEAIKATSWISPTFGVLVGGMFTTLQAPASALAQTMNTGVVFSAQAVPGVDFSIFRNFGLQITFPVTFLIGTSSMVIASQVASLRYEL